MFHLSNTFNSEVPYAGRVISSHRTLDAARAADCRVQRAARRIGHGCYLPTSIVKVADKAKKGDWIKHADLVEFDER